MHQIRQYWSSWDSIMSPGTASSRSIHVLAYGGITIFFRAVYYPIENPFCLGFCLFQGCILFHCIYSPPPVVQGCILFCCSLISFPPLFRAVYYSIPFTALPLFRGCMLFHCIYSPAPIVQDCILFRCSLTSFPLFFRAVYYSISALAASPVFFSGLHTIPLRL